MRSIDLTEDDDDESSGLSDLDFDASAPNFDVDLAVLITSEKPGSRSKGRYKVELPPEVIGAILEKTLEDAPHSATARAAVLKKASLVCKSWTDPARRILFGQGVTISNGPASIQRLREVFDRYPELGRAVHTLNLSAPTKDAKTSKETFRRAAGLVRATPVVKDISLLHVRLTDKVRDRFFSALQTLKPQKAKIVGSGFGIGAPPWTRRGGAQARNDMKAMWLTLCEWSSLKSLEIVGYCDGYQTLPAINSRSDRMPSYQLEEISFSDVEMRGRTLIEFLGANPRSLASLTLESIRYLANGVLSEVFRTVGSTLKFLTISSDLDEGSTDMYDPDILSPLVRLERFDLVSEDSFPQEVLETVCALPSIETVSVTVPAVSYGTATSALDESSRTLDTLSIEIWDSNLWEDGEVWAFAKACEARAVELFFNNMDHDDIEDEWSGIDLSEDWKILEKPGRAGKVKHKRATRT